MKNINQNESQNIKERFVKIQQTFVGNYMTALDMAGFSLTVLKLDSELKKLLAAPAKTPALIV